MELKMDKKTLKKDLEKALKDESLSQLVEEYFGEGGIIANRLALFEEDEQIDFGDFRQAYVLKDPEAYLRKSDVSGLGNIRSFFEELSEYLEKKASAKSQILQNDCLAVISKKKKRCMLALVGLMIVGAIAAIVFTIMGYVLNGDQWSWLQEIPEVIGLVDLCFGAIAFAVERFSDMEGKKVVAAGELYRTDPSLQNAMALGERLQAHNITVCGDVVIGKKKVKNDNRKTVVNIG